MKKQDKDAIASILQSPEYKKAVEERLALMKKEEGIRESADWMGQTGLGEETERELPRYLRREFGESLLDAKSLKADDLKYVGVFREGSDQVHYWRIPSGNEEVYAYIIDSNKGVSLGWGGKKPNKQGT